MTKFKSESLDKKTLRKEALEQRLALSSKDYWHLNDLLLNQIQKFDWSSISYLHLFLPIKEKKEVDTFEILSFFKHHFPQIKIIIPRCNFDNRSLEHVVFDYEHTVLVKSEQHIPEPLYGKIIKEELIDVVLVPLLAFDKKGNRVGYGAGFYDRFLKKCSPQTLKIGLSLFGPILEEIEPDEYDVSLTHCITPNKTYTF